jgi:hypothetical protein
MEFLSFEHHFTCESFTKVNPIDFEPKTTDNFTVQVKTMTGRLHTITVRPSMTVMEVKYLIEKVEQYAPDQQRIVYCGKQLSDEKQLQDYSIQPDVTIHLIIRLRGGMFHETSARKDMELIQCTLVEEIALMERLLALHKKM